MKIINTALLSILAFYVLAQPHAYAQDSTPSQLSAQPQTIVKPCDTPENRAFDFWAGEWKVTTPDANEPGATMHAGDNIIEKIQDGCVLRENWRSAVSPFTGSSFNFFNKAAGQWEQLWLDNQGGRLHLKGNKTGNQMILSSDERPDSAGNPVVDRVTWTENEDGSVHQYWEVISKDKPAVVLFDGFYQRTN